MPFTTKRDGSETHVRAKKLAFRTTVLLSVVAGVDFLAPQRSPAMTMPTKDRYLHFENIDMEKPDISSRCSCCGREFRAEPKVAERVDDVLLRVRANLKPISAASERAQSTVRELGVTPQVVNDPGSAVRRLWSEFFVRWSDAQ